MTPKASITDPDTIWLDLPATPKYLNVLGACLGEMLARVESLTDRAVFVYNVQLAIHEACTNIVDHAYAGEPAGRIKVTLMLASEPGRLVVELYDTGRAFDPFTVPAPDLAEGQVRGYGLFLMRQLLDEITYEPQPGGNRWRLVKNF